MSPGRVAVFVGRDLEEVPPLIGEAGWNDQQAIVATMAVIIEEF